MEINGIPIEDTFAEAFSMHMNRTIITAYSEEWARVTAAEATGFGTSVIKAPSEAGIEYIMKEILRILKTGGKLIGTVPHFANPYFYSDYTHKSFFGLYTFSYFSKQEYFRRAVPKFYNRMNFKINKIYIRFNSPFRIRRFIKNVFQLLFNSCRFLQEFYEENLCYLLPAYDIEFEVEKVQNYKRMKIR